MADENPSRRISTNDNQFLRSQDFSRTFQRGNHQWVYKGNGLEETYCLPHPQNRKTLARIERHDRRKGYFDGGVELLLRTSARGSFQAGHYNLTLEEAFARAERHADHYLRRERALQASPMKSSRQRSEATPSMDREP